MTVNNTPLNWTSATANITTSLTNGTYTISNAYNPILTIPNDGASLEVKGKIIHNGIDLEDRLKTIEKILMIPERDVKLEAKYPKLKKMYDEYIKELSKYRMWESIKNGQE